MTTVGNAANEVIGIESDNTLRRPSSSPLRISGELDRGDAAQRPQPNPQPLQTTPAYRARQEARSRAAKQDIFSIVDIVQTPTGLDTLALPFLVSELTDSSIALADMDEAWTNYRAFKPAATDRKYRWIHFSENNIEWARAALSHIRARLDDSPRKPPPVSPLYTKSFFEVRSNVFNTGSFHSRFMRPHYQRWTDVENKSRNETVFMMPYLHWETKSDYEEMRSLVNQKDPYGSSKSPKKTLSKSDRRFLGLLDRNGIQIRRSLDQSYYWSLKNTEKRDQDQVIDRYAKNEEYSTKPNTPRALLMVDQLWLWILNEDSPNRVIISFFPRIWSDNAIVDHALDGTKDRLDLYTEVRNYLKDEKGKTCHSPLKLVFYMIDRCAGNLLDERPELDVDLQYIEHFNRYIDVLMDKQKDRLETLGEEIKASRLRDFEKSSMLHALKHKKGSKSADNEDLVAGAEKDTERSDEDEIPFHIQKEFDILREIRDIEEELLMIIHVVEQQQEAVALMQHEYRKHGPELEGDSVNFDGMTYTQTTWPRAKVDSPEDDQSMDRVTLDDPEEDERGPTQAQGEVSRLEPGRTEGRPQRPQAGTYPPTSTVQPPTLRVPPSNESRKEPRPPGLGDLAARLKKRKSKMLKLKKKAENTEKSITRLLELKQQQANVLEARSSRQIAEASERQSEAIMLFTIITIVFLPLGTIASIYGMNAEEFGQGGPKLKHIWKVLFGISIPLALVILYLAFHRRFRRILTLLANYIWLKMTHHHCFALLISWEDQLETAVEELKEKAAKSRQPKLEAIDEKKQRRKEKKKKEKEKAEAGKESRHDRERSLAQRQRKEKGKGKRDYQSTSATPTFAGKHDSDGNHDSNDTTVVGALKPDPKPATAGVHNGGDPHRSARTPTNTPGASDSSRKGTAAAGEAGPEGASTAKKQSKKRIFSKIFGRTHNQKPADPEAGQQQRPSMSQMTQAAPTAPQATATPS